MFELWTIYNAKWFLQSCTLFRFSSEIFFFFFHYLEKKQFWWDHQKKINQQTEMQDVQLIISWSFIVYVNRNFFGSKSSKHEERASNAIFPKSSSKQQKWLITFRVIRFSCIVDGRKSDCDRSMQQNSLMKSPSAL